MRKILVQLSLLTSSATVQSPVMASGVALFQSYETWFDSTAAHLNFSASFPPENL
jgi:hypothetical protein